MRRETSTIVVVQADGALLGVLDGQGKNAFYDFIGRGGRRHAAPRALYRARRVANTVTFEELMRIAGLWVESAVKLDESGLRHMLHLVAAQERRRRRQAN